MRTFCDASATRLFFKYLSSPGEMSHVLQTGVFVCFAAWGPVWAHPVLGTSCTGVSGAGICDSVPQEHKSEPVTSSFEEEVSF